MDKTANPKIVSIILVTYCPSLERMDLNQKCFETIHKTGLARGDYELIVINNGGLLLDTSKLDSDVEVKNKINVGQAGGKNQGIKLASGKYVAFMDDDLLFEEGWLKHGIDLLEKYPEEKLIASVRYLDSPERYQMGELDGHLLLSKVGGWWIMKKSLIDECGLFTIKYSEDRDYWKRYLKIRGYRFILSKEPYIFHLGEEKSILKKIYGI